MLRDTRNYLTVENEIAKAAECLIKCFKEGGKLLVCGNGGSSADSDHIVGELLKGFEQKRPVTEKMKNELIEFGGERGAIFQKSFSRACLPFLFQLILH